MRTLKEIDAEIADIRQTARFLIETLRLERQQATRQKQKLPPMTKTQFYRYKNATFHKGMTRDQAIAYALQESAVGSDTNVSPVTTNGCGTSPAGDHTAPAGASSGDKVH